MPAKFLTASAFLSLISNNGHTEHLCQTKRIIDSTVSSCKIKLFEISMPYTCSVLGCSNKRVKGGNLQLFSFPFNDEVQLKAWIHALQRKSFQPSKSSRVCSEHFSPESFVKRPGMIVPYLSKTAVPAIFKKVVGLTNKTVEAQLEHFTGIIIPAQKIEEQSIPMPKRKRNVDHSTKTFSIMQKMEVEHTNRLVVQSTCKSKSSSSTYARAKDTNKIISSEVKLRKKKVLNQTVHHQNKNILSLIHRLNHA